MLGVFTLNAVIRYCRRQVPANVEKRIKEMQIGDYEIKNVNFPGSIIIFQRDIACLDWIQVILKLYEDASSLKKNFSKIQAL